MMGRHLLQSVLTAVLLISISAASFGANPVGYVPGQVFLELRSAERHPFVRAGISRAAIESTVLNKAQEELAKIEGGKGRLDYFRFEQGSSKNSFLLALQVTYKKKVAGIEGKVKCAVRVEFAFPSALLKDDPTAFTFQLRDRHADCTISNDLLKEIAEALLGNINRRVVTAMEGSVVDINASLRNQLRDVLGEPNDILKLFTPAWVALAPCEKFGEGFLCVTIAPPDGSLAAARAALLALAPIGEGKEASSASLLELDRQIEQLLPFAKSERYEGYSYPAALDAHGKSDEGDMALYGGLICIGGDERGCELVRRAQHVATGQFFRSPDVVGCKSKSDQDPICRRKFVSKSQFSGDQFKGVVAYLTKKDDPSALSAWLDYITSRKVLVPRGHHSAVVAYESCEVSADDACVLGSEEWSTLKLLEGLRDPKSSDEERLLAMPRTPEKQKRAARLKGASQGTVPPLPGGANPYDWDPEVLEWQALGSKVGYRLHLVGVQILLLKRLGVSHPSISQTAAVLAARQPNNPFYAFLHLGADRSVVRSALDKCAISHLSKIQDRHSWVWQHDTEKEKWLKDPVIWDCRFLLRLLAEDIETAGTERR